LSEAPIGGEAAAAVLVIGLKIVEVTTGDLETAGLIVGRRAEGEEGVAVYPTVGVGRSGA